MICPKCGQENDATRMFCYGCGMVLPRMYSDNTSLQSNIDIVIDENIQTDNIVSASDCIFLSKILDLSEIVKKGDYDREFIKNELNLLKIETNYIKELLKSFTDEEKGWMVAGIDQIERSYYLFHDAINKFSDFININNISLVNESVNDASQASKMLLAGINQAQRELEKEEIASKDTGETKEVKTQEE